MLCSDFDVFNLNLAITNIKGVNEHYKFHLVNFKKVKHEIYERYMTVFKLCNAGMLLDIF